MNKLFSKLYVCVCVCVACLSGFPTLIESREVPHPGNLQLLPEAGQLLVLRSGLSLQLLALDDLPVELLLLLPPVRLHGCTVNAFGFKQRFYPKCFTTWPHIHARIRTFVH